MSARFFWAAAAAAICTACAAEGDAWFPFVISYGGEANASSVAHLLDAPAAVGDGRARITLSPASQTLWYEVAIKSTRKEKRSGEERQQ